jgi:hypothetical protein
MFCVHLWCGHPNHQRASPLNLAFYDAPAHLGRHFIRFLVAARSNFLAAEYISFNDQVRDTYAKVATFQCCCVKSHRVSHLFIYEFISEYLSAPLYLGPF